jgi:hypothetical protein
MSEDVIQMVSEKAPGTACDARKVEVMIWYRMYAVVDELYCFPLKLDISG